MFGPLALCLLLAQVPGLPTLDLGQLVRTAAADNPEIRAAKRRWEAAQAKPSQVSTLPNPTVSLNYWNAGSPFPGTSVGENPMSFVEPMVTQQIPFPGKLRLRGEIAQKEADSTGRLYEAVYLRLAGEVKRTYFELYGVRRSIETIEQHRELLDRVTAIARAQYEVGSGLQQDVLKAQVERTLLEERLEVFRQNQEILGARLNQLLHRDPDARLGSVPDVEPSPMPFTLEQLYAAAEEANPILDSHRIMVDRSATRLDLARKEHLPDFGFKLGYMHMGRFDDMWDISVSAEIPLFFWRKEQRGVEAAGAELGESMNQFETVAQDLFRQVKQEYLRWTTAERLQSLYSDALIPQASLTLESSLSAYRVGNLDLLAVLNNWSILLNFELTYYDQVVVHEKALANLEQLTSLEIIEMGGAR